MVPFPRSHFQLVGLPVDSSLKCTTKGAHPAVILLENLAINCADAGIVAVKRRHRRSGNWYGCNRFLIRLYPVSFKTRAAIKVDAEVTPFFARAASSNWVISDWNAWWVQVVQIKPACVDNYL